MTFTHADIEQRWLELVYDEVDTETRAAFDAHTSACADCQAKVAALAATREAARTVARAQLSQPAPPAVRARVMEAATRSAAATEARRAAAQGPSAASRWAWLRRRWTLPMFATLTAAMATLLLGRETIFREAHRPLGETVPAEMAAPSPVEAFPEPEAPLLGGGARPVAQERNGEPAASVRRKASGAAAKREHTGESVAKKRQTSPSPRKMADLKEAPAGKPRGSDDADDAERASAAGLFEGKAARKGSLDDALSGTSNRSRSVRSEEDSPALDSARPQATSAAAGPPAAPAPAPTRASAPAPSASPASALASDEAADPAIVDAVRADKLYAGQRWAEAAQIYRNLLERFPAHRQTAIWRAKLVTAQAAAGGSKNDSGRFAQPPPPR